MDASTIASVEFSPAAELALAAAVPRLRFFADAAGARAAVEQMLQLDIRSVHQGRGQAVDSTDGQPYVCCIDALEIGFTTFATHVEVTRCDWKKKSPP